MKYALKTRLPLMLITAAMFVAPALAAPPAPRANSQDQQQAAPDNSKANQNDAGKNATTADRQGMNTSDRDTTKQIRSAIIKDKALSTYAHNVKIITQNGKVTLKGPVRSADEKSAIEEKAVAVAGADNVVNRLTVVPEKQ
ncbi:MAG: BON domain-containing protein [Candidatus Acidiferrales bacterium]